MKFSASFLMLFVLVTACESQYGQLPPRVVPSTNAADLVVDLNLKPESSRLDPSTNASDLTDLNQNLPSPSGQYVISAYSFPTGDRASAIILRVSNRQGVHLDSFVTECSSKQKWALGWHQGEDTVVLQAGTGTTVYSVKSSGEIHLMECPPPVYGGTGLRLMKSKYPDL